MNRPDPTNDAPSRHILVVDDDSTFRRFLVRAIRTLGHTTSDVEGREEMETALKATPLPDIVFLDWNLAHGTAHEMYASLRRRGVPVVVVTGDPMAIHDEVEDILAKPFQLNTLRSLLESGKGAP